MSAKNLKNISASVRQRLLNRAKDEQRPFSELLQYYAMERFLYRMSQSPHADRFILKGALMLRAWHSTEFRLNVKNVENSLVKIWILWARTYTRAVGK
ncbi:nucleotidyl transferase AbiEii/AbiGii toxin family protein [Cylindrospermopsis raciborskii]|uniref:nucleotidyl transferase AbiEii/AbiGii toxin family protein n=1 Tax=Cylindrospermopsis raciborskii TaxID=77022 RepID=UPI0001C15B60|nr:nucleotidyl transferase AbiEii/AbiGii toxin family protein [Cylindrospermopsis raciborskii]EFA71860.1 Putative uncharacterized protein [Raphidiopsis brookii D9]MCZ2207470.1 nucleotidyl transferase AbiEii/AbiGii toxin family protein [Cylindrospermopsis raciborskii PAMP2011]OHY34507.1 hypothetical protein BCV64_05445 [Cylindrospermopsis raciborskii MVCC14]